MPNRPLYVEAEPSAVIALQTAVNEVKIARADERKQNQSSMDSMQVDHPKPKSTERLMDAVKYANPVDPDSDAFKRSIAYRNQDNVCVSLNAQGQQML